MIKAAVLRFLGEPLKDFDARLGYVRGTEAIIHGVKC
jgi:hypothetical protein